MYKAVPFKKYIPSKSPNYSNPESWAVKPDKYPESLKKIIGDSKNKKCDVFFIYPTMFLDRKDLRWNADLDDELLNNSIINRPVKYQASAFGKAGNIYVPFYRQSHYKVYVDPFSKYEEKSRAIAYSDIKRAFKYYLDNYNNGKPIIIASHSQGSILSAMLLKEFFDDKPLQKKLVIAYLPGTKILDDYFKKIKKLQNRDEIGGYVSWNTYRKGSYPKNYEEWFRGGSTSNPITWDNKVKTEYEQHKGLFYTDDKVYPNSVKIILKDGLIWSYLPRIPKRLFLLIKKNYHAADINLFWKDIEINAVNRLKNWQRHYFSEDNFQL
tara:strand:+ start:2728 stop:3699 length:972 start_codon:yes stop_codon:yes gene_type:complete